MGENEQELESNTLLIKNRDFLSVKLYVFSRLRGAFST